MNTLVLELTELLCTYKKMMLLILILSEYNIFQKRLEHLLVIKTKKKNLEYKHMIQQCADIFVLDLLILCLQKRLTRFTDLFSPNNFKKIMI